MPDESRPLGRPLKFQSVEELQKSIDAYFDDCDSTKDTRVWNHGMILTKDEKRVCQDCGRAPDKQGCKVVKGKLRPPRPYTVTGLALWLDTSRQTLLNYEIRADFFDTIKAAKDRIENYAEECLYDKDKPTRGVIFSLSNNNDGWIEKRDTILRMPKDGAAELGQKLFDVAAAEVQSPPADAVPASSVPPAAGTAE